MRVGEVNRLLVNRSTNVGLFLEDSEGNEVLLPTRYVPLTIEPGEELDVYLYHDSEDRLIATTETPLVMANQFAMLEVVDVSKAGAFLNMGLTKDLFVPFRNQIQPMQVGEQHLVWVHVDRVSGRLVGNSNLDQILSNNPIDIEIGDKVKLIVWIKTEIGWRVVVNEEYKGIVYTNQVFQELEVGAHLVGYVNNIREDGRLDILLQKPGVRNMDDASRKVLEAIRRSNGFLTLTDSSSPDDVYQQLGISKKSFKKGVGALYKQRLITIEDTGLRLRLEADAD